jgi:mannose-1-phosphate guanylyltransferase
VESTAHPDLTEATGGVRTPVEETSAVRPAVRTSRQCWAVVLAGGDGTRLQSLTLKIAGDSRPKQFCSIFGEESLLAQTRARLESLFPVHKQMFVVTRAHETYYREELRDVDNSRIIPQPLNRGTGVAVAVALLHILQRTADAVVVLVPCDHYYSDVEAFARTVRSAIAGAEQYPDSIVLVGAEAHYAEVEYGWIEPGSAVSQAPVPLLRVNRFWEKPSLSQARELLGSGCLWNTFVTIGHAKTFLDLLCSQVPNVVRSINEALAKNELETVYRLIPPVDLSHQVLAPEPRRLLTVRDAVSGWADLGNPARIMEILTHNNIQPAWSRDKFTQFPNPSGHRHQARRDNMRQDLGAAASTSEEDLLE